MMVVVGHFYPVVITEMTLFLALPLIILVTMLEVTQLQLMPLLQVILDMPEEIHSHQQQMMNSELEEVILMTGEDL